MTVGYAITNAITASAGLYSRISGVNTLITNASYLYDGWMGKRVSAGTFTDLDGLLIDFGAAKSIVGFGLLNHSIVTDCLDANLTIQGANDAAISLGVVTAKIGSFNSARPKAKEKDSVFLFPAVSKRYWFLQISGTSGNWTGKIGELFAIENGNLHTFSRNPAYGSKSSMDAVTQQIRFQYGEPRNVFLGGPVREETYSLKDWTLAQVQELQALYEDTSGFATPFLWCENVAQTTSMTVASETNCIFGNGMLDALDAVQDDYGVWQPSALIIRSLGREAGA